MKTINIGENVQSQIELLKAKRQKIILSFDNKINALLTNNDFFKSIIKRRKFLGESLTAIDTKKTVIIVKYLLSSPFIYGMIIPSVAWHIGIEIYHNICFRLYGIPLVNSHEYFVYDRQLLSFLSCKFFNFCSISNISILFARE